MNIGAQVNLKLSQGGGGVIAGLSAVSEYQYADITDYDKMVIRGAGNLRILTNRQNNSERTWKELQVSVDESSPYWDSDYQSLIIPLEDLKDRPNNRGGEHFEDYIHLNAIKVNWNANALVKGLYLIPKGGTNDIADNSFRTTTADDAVYDMSGRLVQRTSSNVHRTLPPGIYIKNGKKFIVK